MHGIDHDVVSEHKPKTSRLLVIASDTVHQAVATALENESCLIERVDLATRGADPAWGSDADIVLCEWSLIDAETLLRPWQRPPDISVLAIVPCLAEADGSDLIEWDVQDWLEMSCLDDGHTLNRAIRYAIERKGLCASIRRVASNEEKLRTVFAHNTDAIMVVDAKGRICFANLAASSLFGRQNQNLVGEIFAHPIGSFEPVELDITDMEGTARVVEMRVSAIVWEEKSVNLASFRDITERKSAQDALVDANLMLKSSNQNLDLLMHAISHDLHAPLITISGFSGHARRAIGEGNLEDACESLDRVGTASIRAGQMLSALTELCKVGSIDRHKLSMVDAGLIARELVSELAEPIAKNGVSVDILPDVPHVQSQESYLRHVLQNLLINALKYGCSSREPVIRIGGSEYPEETHLFVQDNGDGIMPEHQQRIFEPFNQVDGNCDGAGIGLAIVQKIVTGHRGRVWVSSSPGSGTTFWVSFHRGYYFA